MSVSYKLKAVLTLKDFVENASTMCGTNSKNDHNVSACVY